ncbi:MAG: efflux transporter outer membrane subunit [Planctomycetes bacterium]|nr:efflux transporter outer membrane subunit [Planctomycetota bacterium]
MRTHRSALTALPLACVLAWLGGCGPGRDYREPEIAAPARWQGPEAADESSAPLSRWWTSFGDDRLDRLIVLALEENLDLRLAVARLDEARARRGVVRWAQLPEIDARGSAERRRYSENVFGPSGEIQNHFDAGFDASWEIDLFRGVRREVEASDADLQALDAARLDMRTVVAAETARAYLDLVGNQELLAVLRADLADLRQARDLVHARVAAGVAPDVDLAQQDALIASAVATLPEPEARRVNALTRLAVLTARPASDVLAAIAQADGADPFAGLPGVTRLPEARALFAAGLPSDLLRRRQDLRRAERAYAAAVARIGVAERALYPRFSLTGTFGLESTDSEDLLKVGSLFWSIGPAVRWPILQQGRIRAQVAAADARAEQAEIAYHQAVLVAFADVEDALAALARAQERSRAIDEALAAHERSLALVRARYERGAIGLISLLTEQRAVSGARAQTVEARTAMALRVVTLAKALGGGWEPAPPGPIADTVRPPSPERSP